MQYNIEIYNDQQLHNVWTVVKPILITSFSKSHFNEGYNSQSVISEIEYEIYKNKNPYTKHILAYGEERNLVGAVFCIETYNREDMYCKVGWFFTSHFLNTRQRIKIADALIFTGHDLIKNSGNSFIETEIGTLEGAQLLKKRYGYEYLPLKNQNNRWVKYLIDEDFE